MPRLHGEIQREFPRSSVKLIELFHNSSINRQAVLLSSQDDVSSGRPASDDSYDLAETSAEELMEANESPITSPSNGSIEEHPLGASQGVAVIGVAGRFPGAEDADTFYERLMERYSGITSRTDEAPPDLPQGGIWVPQAGLLDNVEEFDHDFWNISKEEATDMDPQQRLFMEVALEALDDAGVSVSQTESNNIGLFVGAPQNSYHTVTNAVYGDAFQKANRAMIAPCISARTAYHLNLHGPNVTLNTNCASGTVALSLAVDELNSGKCDMTVVGGVSVQLYQFVLPSPTKSSFDSDSS